MLIPKKVISKKKLFFIPLFVFSSFIIFQDLNFAASAPSVGQVSPVNGSSVAQQNVTFTTNLSDPDGWQDITTVFFLICNPSVEGVFYGYYHVGANKFYMANESLSAWIGGYAPGSNNSIENFYAKLNCINTSASDQGNNLTINWNVTFKSPLAGAKNIYLYIIDKQGNGVGWVYKGSWNISRGSSNSPPQSGSVTVTPASVHPNYPFSFSTSYLDSDGWQDIRYTFLYIYGYPNSFYGLYDRINNRIYMTDDRFTSWLGGYPPGSNNIIENSYFRLDCLKTTVSGFKDNLKVNWNISPKDKTYGTKSVYIFALDSLGRYCEKITKMAECYIFKGPTKPPPERIKYDQK